MKEVCLGYFKLYSFFKAEFLKSETKLDKERNFAKMTMYRQDFLNAKRYV